MSEKWHSFALVGSMFCAILAGCGSEDSSPSEPKIPEARSSLARLAADAPAELVQTLCANNASFALDLLHAAKPDGNFFYSPHSISIALAMTYAGAAGTTKDEMAKVLHFTQPDAELHAAFNTLDQNLASRGKGAKGSDGQPFRLRISNAAWAQKDFAFLPSYLDVLAQNYGAGVKLVDFEGDTESARSTINGWVSQKTESKIPELLQQGDIDTSTALVLTNTVYFNASWATAFKAEATQDSAFTKLDGASVTVPVMHGAVGTSYAQGSGWQAAEIDYDGHEVSLVVILPEAGSFEAFEKSLDQPKLAEITSAFAAEWLVDIALPKLKIRTHQSLGDTLAQMGMPTAFGGDADFSGMTGAKELFIQKVIHEAFVNVNEAGTEAAAATAVSMGKTSAPQTAKLELTRPFLFLIRDKATGSVVFLGRVVDPSAS